MQTATLNLNRGAFNWCLANAHAAMDAGDDESAAIWLSIACESASDFAPFGELASAELEEIACRIARRLPVPAPRDYVHPPWRWMHVVTEVYPVFGHSALIRRWIEQDDSSCIHDIVATGQGPAFPDSLQAAVARTGGEVTCLDRTLPELARASLLRQAAWEKADVIVVHTHPFDIIPTLAFGVAGGPPALLVNHADHVFWPGASVADLVVNIRPSGRRLAEDCRGTGNGAMLPIPLPRPPQPGNGEPQGSLRQAARAQFQIPSGAIVFLTIAQPYKYEPAAGLDYFAAAERILRACHDAYVIAVGLPNTGRASALAVSTQGRFRAVGTQRDIASYHAAADIYLESIPVGSLTALLEASLAGLPCVRAPQATPPTLCADGEALDDDPRPVDLAHYVESAIALARCDDASRRHTGSILADHIRDCHCGAGWTARLEALRLQVPNQHAAPSKISPKPMPDAMTDFWVRVVDATPRPTLSLVMAVALRRSLPPLAPIGVELWKQVQRTNIHAISKVMLTLHAICPLVGL
ncbi:MAG TPA: hypothetical protein VFC46_08815, partial [Humisphaera sp.]|nr:hypothetical protein [Humisphaera sp.]